MASSRSNLVDQIHAGPLHFEISIQLRGDLDCPASVINEGSVLATRFRDGHGDRIDCKLVLLDIDEPNICGYIDEFESDCNCTGSGTTPGFEGCSMLELVRKRTTRCYCDVFRDIGASPSVAIDSDSDTLLIKALFRSRNELKISIRSLREFEEITQVSVRSITEPLGDDSADIKQPIDLSVLTETQRSCLETAIAEGYYDSPRGITQKELANALGISTSMVCNRLRAAHKKLLTPLEL